jgi:CRISPR-associated protein Cmr6
MDANSERYPKSKPANRLAGIMAPAECARGRLAEGRDNSLAIQWLHRAYGYDYKGGREVPLSIKGTSVTGKLNQIGQLWHRMYPVVLRKTDPDNDGKFLPKPTPNYLELLTIFPDETQDFNRFLEFLSHERSGFQRLWGE